MELEQAKKRAAELREVIEKNNRLYYDQDAPELEDYQYDALVRELKGIEAEYPAGHAGVAHPACGGHRQQQVQQGGPCRQDGKPAGCLQL